ncbi:hypothetical protein PCC9214_02756 [Planktothrix tepida]|uniref:Uncharacterized protein n=2 Tax=Planktothrix TaxID=54304 RepID=A0A1J1LNV9_9CYAN|nr:MULTISPECIES: hypothetical protein [Planktothrix]CAD5954255.1 hypothetical protein PCC9214_02756 [Planktothrix tepida]CAD5956384.1 hypothetical protein NO713_02907 [Planktothrix pseudagardhii]CUR34245.1 conserved hypothetical protein [Planktothrix tepida PCC 9214]
MTSRYYDLPEVTILCEDIDQERFIREYLICRGFNKRKIKDFGNPKGQTIKNNNALIVRYYPKLINSYRSRNYRNIAVVVMIDADNDTLSHRMRSLHIALDETAGKLNQDPRKSGDKVAIFVPARNIETWFRYINSYPSSHHCDEMTDYKDKTMSPEERIELAERSARILAREICPQGVDAIALPSLRYACRELQRLWL